MHRYNKRGGAAKKIIRIKESPAGEATSDMSRHELYLVLFILKFIYYCAKVGQFYYKLQEL